MKIQFIGATHEVTGSCILLEVCGKKYLVDCGMEQGIDVFENVPIPVPANTIEAVFLTHAHIDHSGMLPKLYKDGFRGSIYATTTTCDLCNIMLRDSAHIQASEKLTALGYTNIVEFGGINDWPGETVTG